jgi:hypothetical protein
MSNRSTSHTTGNLGRGLPGPQGGVQGRTQYGTRSRVARLQSRAHKYVRPQGGSRIHIQECRADGSRWTLCNKQIQGVGTPAAAGAEDASTPHAPWVTLADREASCSLLCGDCLDAITQYHPGDLVTAYTRGPHPVPEARLQVLCTRCVYPMQYSCTACRAPVCEGHTERLHHKPSGRMVVLCGSDECRTHAQRWLSNLAKTSQQG